MHGMQPSPTEGPRSMPQLASHDIADEELFTLVLQVARHGWIQGPCSAGCDQGEGQQDNVDEPMQIVQWSDRLPPAEVSRSWMTDSAVTLETAL